MSFPEPVSMKPKPFGVSRLIVPSSIFSSVTYIGGAVLQQETLLQRDYVKGRFNRDVRRLHFATTQNGPVDPAAVNRRSQTALIGSCPRPACV